MHKIDGKLLANKINDYTSKLLATTAAKLVILMLSDDVPSQTWVERKQTKAAELGIETEVIKFDKSVTTEQVLTKIAELNASNTNGILVQLPLYPHLEADRSRIVQAVDPHKDVDGLHPLNQGLLAAKQVGLIPATVLAVVEAINSVENSGLFIETNQLNLKGKHVVIVNDSILIGRPLMQLMLNLGATVSVCHEFTSDLKSYTLQADILVSATGIVGLITPEFIKPGAIVVDITTKKTDSGLKGDVVFTPELIQQLTAYTPVPGGIGPLTVSLLMFNVAKQATR
jgi:methylenetetrahydrofolate dehydrogenase (NADP+)/methenyltetrahydrofolate cyclohydrolase